MPPAASQEPEEGFNPIETLGEDFGGFFDPAWYLKRYPDVAAAGADPLQHYLHYGAAENRDPNRFFDAGWYLDQNPDVARAGINPALHYLQNGAEELRNPHPRFDAAYYVEEHPEATRNPLLFHLRIGAARGWETERTVSIENFLPSRARPLACPKGVRVDVVVPVYRGLKQTRRCLGTVLGDPDRLPGRVIVIDDRSPEPKLSAWLDRLAARGDITLLRNKENRGFVASANRGMAEAGDRDVVLLNADTEVPRGWLRRLAAHAYAHPRIASVSPFSNNATICSYPAFAGGALPLGRTVGEIDAACQAVQAGRSVDVPTTVGFCMYIRRDALAETGAFDEAAFRRGYGEENDFCMRAAALGWRHRLACDVFVYHEGEVSFGKDSPELERSRNVLVARHPTYQRFVARHIRADPAAPFRFALTARLFRASAKPTILLASHGLGGGVRQHLGHLRAAAGARANFLLLDADPAGFALSVPALPGHPVMRLGEERIEDLAAFLRSASVERVHLHHLMASRIDLRRLIHLLGVPFDFTVHDYFTLCPRVNLLPTMDSQYCGEPGPAVCNDCIAQSPAHGARDILDWRNTHRWALLEAERVICPTEDVRRRLTRHGLGRNAVVALHEAVPPTPWPLRDPAPERGRRLRVALIGVLAGHKGGPAVEAVAATADGADIDLRLIGYAEQELPEPLRPRLRQTGPYEQSELPSLLGRMRPHVLWFPAQWPETYSYTLSAAITSGLPIVASAIGAFPERLKGRPRTRLVEPGAPAAAWIAAFREAADAAREEASAPVARAIQPDFYTDGYLRPVFPPPTARRVGPIDIRRPGRPSIVVVPERLDTGCPSPCAYIRLLLPLDHPAIGGEADIILADAAEARRYRADMIVTHRHAVPEKSEAEALVAHCRAQGVPLVYDLDDDLIEPPSEHPDFATLRERAAVVGTMVAGASSVWVSTRALRDRLAGLGVEAAIVPNGLDERLWSATPPAIRVELGRMRVLLMGTATHDADLALIEPALRRLREEFVDRVSIDVIGITARGVLPDGINRIDLPQSATSSYPGFVNWITRQPRWEVGLAPLLDTPFNRAKSSIKTLDYAALGMLTLASDMSVYRGSLADGAGGTLAANTPEAWYAALARLLRDPMLRERLASGARGTCARDGTLSAQAQLRQRLLRIALMSGTQSPQSASNHDPDEVVRRKDLRA